MTDCHVNAVSEGTGEPENSAPFNVFNSAGAYDPPADAAARAEWWSAVDPAFAWRHEYVPRISLSMRMNVVRLRAAASALRPER